MSTITTKKGTVLPLLDLKGKDYLQVMYRLVWFREEHPDWSIQTEYLQLTEVHAIARAVVVNDKGFMMATAHKREDKAHFTDYTEKAETGAIGRALALVGYGTQFDPDLDEGERVVDSPVTPRGVVSIRPDQPQPGDGTPSKAYQIPFGTKYRFKTLDQVGYEELKSYVNWLEDSAKKKKVPLQGDAVEFVRRAVAWIIDFELSLHQGDAAL